MAASPKKDKIFTLFSPVFVCCMGIPIDIVLIRGAEPTTKLRLRR